MKHNLVVPIISIAGLAVLILMLTLTSPTEIGPFGVLLFFTTLYLVSFGIIALIVQAYRRLALKKFSASSRDLIYPAVLAFGPIMLLMARSFGAVNLWTVSLIILFLILAEFFVAKRS